MAINVQHQGSSTVLVQWIHQVPVVGWEVAGARQAGAAVALKPAGPTQASASIITLTSGV